MPSSPKRWRRQFLKCLGCCCPGYSPLLSSPLSLLGYAVGSSSSSIHLKIWHQMSASASASPSPSSFVVCMPICARFSLVFPFSIFLYPYSRYISFAVHFVMHKRRHLRCKQMKLASQRTDLCLTALVFKISQSKSINLCISRFLKCLQ